MFPDISVIMAVYNAEKYLEEAIDSILAQTFRNFEFIIVNDCSDDCSADILRDKHDDRIILIENESNIGLTKCLNLGMNKARGKYIARMDADDISLPERFFTQFHFMELNQDIGICGSWVKTIGNRSNDIWIYPSDCEVVKAATLFMPVFAHPTIFVRRSFLDENEVLYDEKFLKSQDFDFASRCVHLIRVTNIKKVLLYYRTHDDQIGSQGFSNQSFYADLIRKNNVTDIIERVTIDELDLHNRISNVNINDCCQYNAIDVFLWLKKIRQKNKTVGKYNSKALFLVQSEVWVNYSRRSQPSLLFFLLNPLAIPLTIIGIILKINKKLMGKIKSFLLTRRLL